MKTNPNARIPVTVEMILEAYPNFISSQCGLYSFKKSSVKSAVNEFNALDTVERDPQVIPAISKPV
jgi:hypothetical protein